MIELYLPFPPSVNGLYDGGMRTKRRFKSKKYKDWESAAMVVVLEQKQEPISGSVVVEIGLKKPDKRRRDCANYEKAVSDLLVSMKLIEDDCLIERLTIYWDYAANYEGCKVSIIPYLPFTAQ